jgi:hypothetical protein
MKSNADSAPRDIKTYLIAQEYIECGVYYYVVEAATMGEAVAFIEHDPEILPIGGDTKDFRIVGYTESEDKYDS